MSMAPRDLTLDDDDGDHDQPDPHDDADLGFDVGPSAGALDPLAAFLKPIFMLLHHKNKYDFKYSLYPVFMISGTHYIIVLYTSQHDIMGF